MTPGITAAVTAGVETVVVVIDHCLIQSYEDEFPQGERLIRRSKSCAEDLVFPTRRIVDGEAALSIKADMAENPEKLEMQGRLGDSHPL